MLSNQVFWQTPSVADVTGGHRTRSGTRSHELLLKGQVEQWATPDVRDWPTATVCGNYNRKGASATSGDGLATAVAGPRDPVSPNTSGSRRARLNPRWVATLMGFPVDWL